MKCPNCKLENPINSIRCDCGFDFQSNALRESLLSEKTSYEKPGKFISFLNYEADNALSFGAIPGFLISMLASALLYGEYKYSTRAHPYLFLVIVLFLIASIYNACNGKWWPKS